jgi:hypothetical protein
MENFNLNQVEKIREIIKDFHKNANNFGLNSKAENIKMFKDDENNFYVSYLGTYLGPDGETADEYYLKVDSEGKQERLNYKMTAIQLKEFFKTLTEIKL